MIVDEFYTAMLGDSYLYVAGRHGLAKSVTPRKTMTFRGEGAEQKVHKKLDKVSAPDYYNKSEIKVVKVTVEKV